jgi:hypothetical protein
MKLLQRWSLGVAAAAVAAAIPSSAAPLAAGSTNVQCSADGNSAGPLPTECEVGGIPGVPSSAAASAGLSPLPFVEVSVSSPTNGVFGAGAGATAFYRFQVTGGNAGDVVPVLIDARLSASSTPDSSALAKIIVNSIVLGQTPLVEEVCTGELCEEDSSFDGTLSFATQSGSTADSVTLSAQGQATATHASNETAQAFADPYIYVDPAFPDAGLYSVVVSEGTANVPVPEPAQATLSLVGFAVGALGLARRRRR